MGDSIGDLEEDYHLTISSIEKIIQCTLYIEVHFLDFARRTRLVGGAMFVDDIRLSDVF